ncbi:MAG: hypothetical protein Kow00121_41680 [Elainellaceae cyanobacterium]
MFLVAFGGTWLMQKGTALLKIQKIPASELTLEGFKHQYQTLGIPVIITGLIPTDWDWSLEYLCEQLGNQEFVLRYYGNQRYQQDKRKWTSIGSGVTPKSQPFLEYAELLRQRVAHTQDIYLAKCSIAHTPLLQTQAIDTVSRYLNAIGLCQPASALNLWVGPSGHVECLHYDPTDGTLIQLHGAKRVILFPPSQTANLYPYSIFVHLRYGLKLRSWFSQVYPDRPDFQAFPKFRQALQYRQEIILNQGEILYIPAGWWHEVTALVNEMSDEMSDEMVCSVNRFWQVYPTQRAICSWARWRAYLGSLCAVPNLTVSTVMALFSQDRKRKLKEIRQMF